MALDKHFLLCPVFYFPSSCPSHFSEDSDFFSPYKDTANIKALIVSNKLYSKEVIIGSSTFPSNWKNQVTFLFYKIDDSS